MRDDGFNFLKGKIGGGLLLRQHAGGIKNIQPLVFHGSHVEIINCYNHENIQVIFTTIDILIPGHGLFQ